MKLMFLNEGEVGGSPSAVVRCVDIKRTAGGEGVLQGLN